MQKINANVVFVNIEGGFWGLQGTDGVRYRPVNGLPPEFQQEGLQVSAEVRPWAGMSTIMWGRDVELIGIATLT